MHCPSDLVSVRTAPHRTGQGAGSTEPDMKPIHSGLGIVTAVVSAGLLISLVACSAKLKNQGPDQGCTDSACGTGGAGGSGSASAAGASGASGSDSADPES